MKAGDSVIVAFVGTVVSIDKTLGRVCVSDDKLYRSNLVPIEFCVVTLPDFRDRDLVEYQCGETKIVGRLQPFNQHCDSRIVLNDNVNIEIDTGDELHGDNLVVSAKHCKILERSSTND